jgi:single-stranded DNA-specific DHH superfamily exonuclease
MGKDPIGTYRKAALRFIRDHDNFSLLYHNDTDGIVSAFFITKTLRSLGKKISESMPMDYSDFEKRRMPRLTKDVITCDIGASGMNLSKTLRGKNILVIDHHELVPPRKFLLINPKAWGDFRYTPCSLLTYLLFGDYAEGYAWLSAVGTVADAGAKDNKKFVKNAAKTCGIGMGKDQYMWDTDFGKAAGMINSMTVLHGKKGSRKALSILLGSESIDEVLKENVLVRAYKTTNREITSILKDFRKRHEDIDGKIYIYELNPKDDNYNSTMATILGLKKEFSRKIIVMMVKDRGTKNMRVSLRANGVGKGASLPKALEKVFDKMDGQGGGHNKAAGATIKAKDKEKFKALLVKYLKEQI